MSMMDRIREARLSVRKYELRLQAAKEEVKEWRESMKDAQVHLNKLLDDESAGVQDLPLGEADDDDALNRRLDELSAEAKGELAWLEDYVARDMMARIAPDHQATNREPAHHGEPIEDDDDGPLLPEREHIRTNLDEDGEPFPASGEYATHGWDNVTSRAMTQDAKAEADALAKIEGDTRGSKPKRSRKAKAQ